MRLWQCQSLLLCALLVNVVILYYFWKLQQNLDQMHRRRFYEEESGGDAPVRLNIGAVPPGGSWPLPDSDGGRMINERKNHRGSDDDEPESVPSDPTELAKLITVVVREFEFFENDVPETVKSFLKVMPTVRIVILADAYPYPPLQIQSGSSSTGTGNPNVQVVVLHPRVDEPPLSSRPEHHISTRYVLLVPDSVRITSTSQVEAMLARLLARPDTLVAARVAGEKARCLRLEPRLREWTLQLHDEPTPGSPCDAVAGTCAILARRSQLFDLSQPFSRPFPFALFVQATIRQWKVHIMDQVVFQQGRPLFLDAHLKWKHADAGRERLKMLYEDFGIRRVVQSSGDVDWFGCTKTSTRCFGTVVNDMPEYLYAGRLTPPCCLQHLRETARHVFETFRASGVRYWLEGGSLLGAARNGDIIPWDYDVDVGIYAEDAVKCNYLRDVISGGGRAVTTGDGYVWEKASEGDFYRVQFSQSNHLHVDVFPFRATRAGVMTKSTWFKTHRQDMEFPEHYLRPLTTIKFAGVEAAAPNNIREFLELKFGEGAIENPQYPDPAILAFVNSTSSSNIGVLLAHP